MSTPARASIRDSVAILTRITSLLRRSPKLNKSVSSSSFEDAVHISSKATSSSPTPLTSCGETQSCVARLFLRKHDGGPGAIEQVTHPHPLIQLVSNRNVLFYLFATRVLSNSVSFQEETCTFLRNFARTSSVNSCIDSLGNFKETLNHEHGIEEYVDGRALSRSEACYYRSHS